MKTTHSIEFIPSGRGKAQCPPDPKYPDGKDMNAAGLSELSCKVALPYPAPECGHFVVRCAQCKMSVAITAAGRPDDPKTVAIRCKIIESPNVH